MCQNQVNYLICDSSGEELAPVLILLHSTGESQASSAQMTGLGSCAVCHIKTLTGFQGGGQICATYRPV